MKALQTVSGPVPTGKVGVTLVHEHIFFDSRVWWRKPTDKWYRSLSRSPLTLEKAGLLRRGPNYSKTNLLLDEFDVAAEEMEIFGTAGGDTILELSVQGIGRSPEALQRLSRKTGVKIVAPTGYYVEDSHPSRVRRKSVEQLAEEFVRDIRQGIGSTGVRAGVIGEIGISPDGNREEEEKVLKAAGRAQVETDAPLTVHTWGDSQDRMQPLHALDILESENVDLTRVYMSHMDGIDDVNYVKKVAERGAYIAFDAFGQEFPALFEPFKFVAATDLQRAKALKEMIESGFLPQMLLSQDICKKSNLRTYGGHGYAHLLTTMKRIFDYVDVGDDTLRTIMMENPRKILAFEIPP